jgi:probable phosphoglycerate mutase
MQVACQKLMTILGEAGNETLSDKLIVISSDFRRAKETAKIIHQHFQAKSPLRLEHSLRERNFGELNLTETSNYQKVWVHDAQDPNHTAFGCESVMSVFSRTSALVASLEAEYRDKGKVIVLVSHGDTLQITLTAYTGVAPECHRTLDHLANCDVRELVQPIDR